MRSDRTGGEPLAWPDPAEAWNDDEWPDAEDTSDVERSVTEVQVVRVGSSGRQVRPPGHEQVTRPDEVPDTDIDTDADADLANPTSGRTPFGVRRIGRHWGRFAELWVPESLRDARVDPGRRGALILLLVAALAAVVTAVGVWRDRPEPRAVETSAIAALAEAPPSADTGTADSAAAGSTDSAATNAPAPSSPTATAPAEIVVSVTGLVGQPGLVTLPTGARVADAIAAAGGASADADLTGVNLAARLADGDSVVVASAPAPGGVASGVTGGDANAGGATDGGAAASGLVDLNTADEAALDTLPGVGPVMAQNILAWREANGKFTTVEQLQEISGIGPSRYAQISPLVTVS